MSSDLSITRVGAVSASVEGARPGGASPAGKRGEDAVPAGRPFPNPTLRLDPGLAIVVIEFRDETGTVRSTIPTEQQLDAYRSWERGHLGEPPRGRRKAGTPEAAVATVGSGKADTPAKAAAPATVGDAPAPRGGVR